MSEPAVSDKPARARLLITTAPRTGSSWSAQLDLIRSSGASYDQGVGQWFLFYDLGSPPVDSINVLFEAAARFGAKVVLDIISSG